MPGLNPTAHRRFDPARRAAAVGSCQEADAQQMLQWSAAVLVSRASIQELELCAASTGTHCYSHAAEAVCQPGKAWQQTAKGSHTAGFWRHAVSACRNAQHWHGV